MIYTKLKARDKGSNSEIEVFQNHKTQGGGFVVCQ